MQAVVGCPSTPHTQVLQAMMPNEELHAGAKSANPAQVAAALAAGAEVDSLDRGWTALSWLCAQREASEGHLECIKLLLAAGADHKPAEGALHWTPLHWATQQAPDGHAQCVAALLAAGADPLARDVFGGVPLHFAATRGHLGAVHLLAEAAPAGAVLVQDNLGQTPLQVALRVGPMSIVSYLVGGVRLSSREIDGALRVIQHAGFRDPELQCQLLRALVSWQTLTAQQWERIPSLCLGIGTALPAALQRLRQRQPCCCAA